MMGRHHAPPTDGFVDADGHEWFPAQADEGGPLISATGVADLNTVIRTSPGPVRAFFDFSPLKVAQP